MATRKRIEAHPEVYFTVSLARFLGVSRVTVWRHARSGRLPPRDFMGLGWRAETIRRHLETVGAM